MTLLQRCIQKCRGDAYFEAKETLKTQSVTLLEAKAYRHDRASKILEMHRFHVTAGLSRHTGAELLIFPTSLPFTDVQEDAVAFRQIQEDAIAFFQRCWNTITYQHGSRLNTQNQTSYLLLDFERCVEPKQLEAFREKYFYPTVAVLRSSDFKMFSMTPMA